MHDLTFNIWFKAALSLSYAYLLSLIPAVYVKLCALQVTAPIQPHRAPLPNRNRKPEEVVTALSHSHQGNSSWYQPWFFSKKHLDEVVKTSLRSKVRQLPF